MPAPSPLEFGGGQPARLEVLVQVRQDRVTVGGRLYRGGEIIPGHDVQEFLPSWLMPSRPVVSGTVA